LVESIPSCITVPSTSPIRTKSPIRSARDTDHETAHDLVHQPARAQRDDEAHQHADALERIGLAPRHIGKDQDNREQPGRSRQQPARGLRGFGMQPSRACDAALLERMEPEGDEADNETRQEHDDRDRDEAGYRMGDSQTDVDPCFEQKPAHRLAPGSREREPAQDDRDDAVGDHQVEDGGDVGCQAALDLDQPGRPQQVHVGNAGPGHRSLGQVNQPGRDGPVRAGDDERQQPACQQHRERHRCRAHQPRGRPRFVRLIERLLETPGRPCGSLVEGFSRQLVYVWRGQHQHGAPAGHDEGGALQHPRFDLMGFSARDEIVHQAARAQRALGGPPPQHTRPQDDDGPVEEHDGRCFSG
jgi:hypothetical protein